MGGKRVLCLCVAALLAVGCPMGVHAEELTGREDRCVTFTGSKLENNFGDSEFVEEAADIQPGDTMRLQVAVTNTSGKQADWYMKNEVIRSFEENSIAEGGAYTYKLSYVDPAGQETVLYNSSAVGGENTEGLKQAENDAYFYLDRLATGEKGMVYLTVGLDGETMINDYQATLAQLGLNFAVEEVPTAGGGGGGGNTVTYQYLAEEGVPLTGTLIDGLGGNAATSPKTGDTANLLWWSLAALLSGSVLLFLWSRKSGRKEEEV